MIQIPDKGGETYSPQFGTHCGTPFVRKNLCLHADNMAKGFIEGLTSMRSSSLDDDLEHRTPDEEVVDRTVPVLPLGDEVLTQKLDELFHACLLLVDGVLQYSL